MTQISESLLNYFLFCFSFQWKFSCYILWDHDLCCVSFRFGHNIILNSELKRMLREIIILFNKVGKKVKKKRKPLWNYLLASFGFRQRKCIYN